MAAPFFVSKNGQGLLFRFLQSADGKSLRPFSDTLRPVSRRSFSLRKSRFSPAKRALPAR